MKHRILMVLVALGLCAGVHAATSDYARVSFVQPGVARGSVNPAPYIKLVIEGSFVSYDKTPVTGDSLIHYVNKLLEDNEASYIAIYVREGINYGDVVRALDTLRKTSAKSIGVSLVQLPVGRDLS